MVDKLFQILMDNLPDYIFFKDRQSRFIKTNNAHAQLLLGLTDPEQAVGKTDFDLFPGRDEDSQRFYEEEQMVMSTGQPIIAREWRVPSSATGNIVWLSEHKIPITDETGQVTGLMGFGRDITARKQAEITRDKLTLQLRTAIEIGRAVTGILDPQQLLQQLVNLIRDRFDLYYVGLFLVEDISTLREKGKRAVLRSATGEAGQQLLNQAYKVKLTDGSMVGECINTRQSMVTSDAFKERAPLAPTLFPEAQTELALPLVSRDEVIGALSIYAVQENAFTADDIAVFQLMADQLAIALENARLFMQTEEELEAVKNDLRRYIRSSWSDYLKK